MTDASTTEDALRLQRDAFLEELTGPMKKAVANSMAKAPQLWAEAFGSVNAKADNPAKLAAVIKALRSTLPDVPKGMEAQVTKAAIEAQKISVAHSVAVIPTKVMVKDVTVPKDAKTAARGLMVKAEKLAKMSGLALGNLDTGSRFSELTAALSLVSQSANSIDAGASYAMQTAATDAVSQVADAAGVGTVIVGERNACLDCTDYQGKTNEDTDDLPPFHPHCLCITQPWSPAWADKGEVSFPDALKREAERSIARGSSDHDSSAARVRAASVLLKTGTKLPASVQAVAKRAVRNDGFPTNSK